MPVAGAVVEVVSEVVVVVVVVVVDVVGVVVVVVVSVVPWQHLSGLQSAVHGGVGVPRMSPQTEAPAAWQSSLCPSPSPLQ